MTVSEASAASGIALRPAALEDAAVIARLHDHVWRETYRDLATPAAWEGLTEAVRLARWREVLADQVRWTTLVAEREKQIVGFGSAGAPSEPIFEGRGEVRWLHVAPTLQGMGVGRRLMSALTPAMTARPDSTGGWAVARSAASPILGRCGAPKTSYSPGTSFRCSWKRRTRDFSQRSPPFARAGATTRAGPQARPYVMKPSQGAAI